MPRPSLQNRNHFKTYVRHFKNKFTSAIQDITFGDIENILIEKPIGISSETPIKFIIFENFDTVDITELKDNRNYIYIPGLPNDDITLKVNGLEYDFKFTNDDSGIIYNGNKYILNDTENLPGIGFTVSGLGGVLLELSPGLPVPSYSIGVSTTLVSEGENIVFTIETINVGAGTTLYYDIPGVDVSDIDFVDSTLTGFINVVSTGATTGVATIVKGIAYDYDNIELDEFFNLNIRTDSNIGTIVATSSTITIKNTGIPTYNVGVSTETVDEGDSVVFTVDTTNHNIGIGTLFYTIVGSPGISSSDFVDNTLSGSLTLVSTGATTGISTIIKNITNDLSLVGSENQEYFQIEIRSDSPTGSIVATSSSIFINNTSFSSYTLTQSSTEVSEGSSVDFTLATDGVPDGTTLYYTSSNTQDISPSSGSFIVNSGISTFTVNVLEDTNIESNETFNISVRTISTSGDIVGISSTITILNTTAIGITESTTTINEGEVVTLNVNTTGIPNGSTLYYTVNPDTGVSPTSGSFSINNNLGSFSITANRDFQVESTEPFQVEVRTDSVSGGIVTTSNNINIVDVPYSLEITSDATVVEGNTILFTINTTGILDSTTLYYTTSGISTADIPTQSGSFTILNDTGSFSLLPTKDLYVDDGETFTIQIRAGSTTGTILATSNVVTIEDLPYIITITPSSTVIVESTKGSTSTLTFNVSTSNIDDGTQLTARIVPIDGGLISADFTPNILVRTFTLSSSSASFSWDIVRDALTEGTERFTLNIEDSEGNILAESPTISIADASFIGSRHEGKTFGPIRVNRDEGNTSQVSDWFTLCGLDKFPDGSKVALFIDTSGSMNLASVGASYNAFIEKINERNMDVIVVYNSNEDWISPFNTVLD